jgi:hypothetical protein
MERAELLDFLDAHGSGGGQAEFGAGVVEADVLDVVGLEGPVEFVTEVGDEGRERLDAAEPVEIGLGLRYSAGFARDIRCGILADDGR